EFVIAGDSAGGVAEKPRADLKRPWAAIQRRAKLKGIRIHDLRHTHASFGAAGGLGLPVIGKLLGHKQAATTARYAHLDVDPLRRASENIGRRIADALGDAPLRKARRGNKIIALNAANDSGSSAVAARKSPRRGAEAQ
ncbi:MAG: tyrosine-type recombinase/integrase, partial [Pseudorhodoplanes sp.]|nr:tyrosine-type recombinase/integrase [Pseudorhodoplanes sp.]